MLGRLRSWIEDDRRSGAAHPYLASLYTVGTHDPYTLPEDAPRELGAGPFVSRRQGCQGAAPAAFAEALRFLDEQLGSFYDWYLREEAPRGTVLMIVADHVAAAFNEPSAPESRRYDIPLIVAGLDPELLAERRSRTARRASQHDIPSTLLGLLDVEPGPCDQGQDLLAQEGRPPGQRLLYAVDGDELTKLHVWSPEAALFFDRRSGRLQLLDAVPVWRQEPLRREVSAFLEALFPLSEHLTWNDAFTRR